MCRVFLIDYENVNWYGVRDIRPETDDTVIIMFTDNSKTIPLDAFENMEAKMRVIKVSAGKQSLDMHLVSYLGYLIKEEGEIAQYRIISNDSDFDKVISFWAGKGIDIERQCVETGQTSICAMNVLSVDTSNITPFHKPKAKKSPTKKQALNHTLQKICNASGLSQKDGGKVCHIVMNACEKRTANSIIQQRLCEEFGKRKGGQIFSLVAGNI